MTLIALVLGRWLALSVVVAVVFVALVRGSGGAEAWSGPVEPPAPTVPGQRAGVEAEAAWHVGDLPEADVEGARRAGITPVLIAREGDPPAPPAPPGVRVIR